MKCVLHVNGKQKYPCGMASSGSTLFARQDNSWFSKTRVKLIYLGLLYWHTVDTQLFVRSVVFEIYCLNLFVRHFTPFYHITTYLGGFLNVTPINITVLLNGTKLMFKHLIAVYSRLKRIDFFIYKAIQQRRKHGISVSKPNLSIQMFSWKLQLVSGYLCTCTWKILKP